MIEKESKKIRVVPIYFPVIAQLELFQKDLDNPKKKLLVKDLREWAAHLNFIMAQLLKDVSTFIIGNERISQLQEKFLEQMEKEKERDEKNGNYFS